MKIRGRFDISRVHRTIDAVYSLKESVSPCVEEQTLRASRQKSTIPLWFHVMRDNAGPILRSSVLSLSVNTYEWHREFSMFNQDCCFFESAYFSGFTPGKARPPRGPTGQSNTQGA